MKGYWFKLRLGVGELSVFGNRLPQLTNLLLLVLELFVLRSLTLMLPLFQFTQSSFQLDDFPSQGGRLTGGCRSDPYRRPPSLCFQPPTFIDQGARQSRDLLLQLGRF